MMIDKKQLIYALTLQINKITLRVRFPCTVCCTLKTDGIEREINGEGDLHNGQAVLNLTHIAQIAIPYKKEYLSFDKKCSLLIYLKSSSGRIPAGSVNLPLMRAESRAIREISRIDKCPDKNAFIEFEMKLQKLEERKDTTIATTLEKQSWLFKHQGSQRNIKLAKSQSPEKSQEDKNASSRLMKNSQVQSSIALRRMGSRRDEGRSSILDTYYSGERKIADSQKVFGLQRQIDSFKTKIMILENEISSKNQKYGEIEKEMKQIQKKNETLDLQLKSTLSKMQYTERANKQLANQIKQLKEKAEQQKLNFQNALKRLEIRQNGYKQQIKVVSEKLYGSENEKQRMIYQKNLSSNEFEGRQKKLRQTFKEKQKKLLEQRTNMLKKIDSLQKDLEKAKQDITQSKSKNTDNIQQVHELKLAIDTAESQRQRFRSECNDLKFQLTKVKNEKRILEENLESINKFAEQRRGFRKQLNDKDIENCQFKDRITSLQSQVTKLRTQNDELDKSLKEKNANIKLLERDYNLIAKENGILMNDINDKESKIGSLMEQLQLQMKRSKYLEGNAVNIEQQFESKQDELERQLREFTAYRSMLEEEVDKLNQQIECSNNQAAAYMKDIHELEQILEEKNEWVANLESQLIQLNSINQQWQMEKIELAEDKKELQEKYHLLHEESQEREKDLNSRVTYISQKWEENSSQLQRSLTEANQKIKMLNNILKEKEERLASSNSCNISLEERISAAFRQKETLISQKLSLNTEIHSLKNLIALSKEHISDRDAFIQSLRNSVENIKKQNDQLLRKNEALTSDLKSSQATMKRINEEFLNHRQTNYQVLDIINCNIKSTSTLTLAAHPDQTCNLKANQILMSIADRNKDLQRHINEKQKKIAQLQDALQDLTEERDLKEQGLAAAGQHLELLKRSTSEFSDEIISKIATIKQLNDRIKAKQQEIEELETTNNKKILGLNSIISQKNRQYTELKQSHDELEALFENLSLELKNANIEIKKLEKQKKIFENDQKSKLSITDSNLRTEMERGNILQADKSFLEKQLRQERQNLRKVMRELQSKCYEFEDLQLRLDEHTSVLSYKESELKRLKDGNYELKLLFDIICSFEAGREGQCPSKVKMETFLSETTSKQSEIIKQKVGIYYENLTSLMSSNLQLQEKLRILSSQQELVSREQPTYEKAVANFELKLQEITQMREKENQSKLILLKSFEEQKQSADVQRRLAQDTFRLLSSLQKQKKVSVFAVAPVKQLVKKLEEQSILMVKAVNFAINKNKREWDLANIRAKKKNPMREEVVHPATLRP